jgi:cation diffusion facilitator CzcD-associated flavoprotein CzcO
MKINYTVLERSRVGSTWWNQYDSLTLNSVKHLSFLPGMRMPRHYPIYPAAREFAMYLEAYAGKLDIPVWTGCEVTSIRNQGREWVVSTSSGELLCRIVVVATGTWGNPFVPVLPGLSSYSGPVIHSSTYRSARTFERGIALVVGNGSSAADIAVDLAGAGHEVLLSFRTGFNIIPRPSGFVMPCVANYLVRWSLTHRLITATAARIREDLRHLGLPTHPESYRDIGRRLILGDELVRAVQTGTVRPMPEIHRFTPEGVEFRTGGRTPIDLVVLATGYRPAVTFAQPYIRVDDGGYVVSGRNDWNSPPLFSIGLSSPDTTPEGVLPGLRRRSAKLMTQIISVLSR